MSFLQPDLPNLELLVYKAKQGLSKHKEFLEKFEKLKKEKKYIAIDFDVIMFPQMWGSTCTGFDVMPNGEPAISGSAMTKEYTTVVHETATDTYVVFFGDTPCYIVTSPKAAFFDDINRKMMKSLSEALKEY